MRAKVTFALLLMAVVTVPGFAQLTPSAKWATEFAAQYTVNANLTYRTASNQQLKMDVYYRRNVTSPQPTVVYMHGGFWVAGAKETAITALMPWLEMGWNVVNVEYRLGVAADPTTLAPAAVDDCFCALRFVAALPANYNIDRNRIVVTGESAGGHLALSMGILPETVGLGRECAGAAAPAHCRRSSWRRCRSGRRACNTRGPSSGAAGCRNRELVRRHRRTRCDRWTEPAGGGCPLVRRHAERARGRQESFTVELRSRRPASHHHDPWRRRPRGALSGSGSVA